ncbi:MAG: hypothetical protein AAB706_00345 [Patescibacteria group bacterium]
MQRPALIRVDIEPEENYIPHYYFNIETEKSKIERMGLKGYRKFQKEVFKV